MSPNWGILFVGGELGCVRNYKKVPVMLYSRSMRTESKTAVEMDNSDIAYARFPFPATGPVLVPELERILVAETKIADNALLGSLQSYIVEIFESWFPGGNPELMKILKRLTNSLSATGSVPELNTKKALEEIDSWKKSQGPTAVEKAAELLRAGSKDFRQARTFLFHQSKCVNGVIGFLAQHDDLSVANAKKVEREISSFADLVKWAEEMSELFVKTRGGEKNLKNAKMYSGLWERFVSILADNSGENEHPYSQFLAGRVREYLDKKAGSNFEQALVDNFADRMLSIPSVNASFQSSKPDFVTPEGLPVEIKIASGVVTLIFTLAKTSESRLDRILTELTFDFATKKQFLDLGISIQLQKQEPPLLLVSVANMDSVTDLEQVKRYISKKIAE